MESGTRCPARSDQTRWSLSCCCPPTPGRPDEASPVQARTDGRETWGKGKRYKEDQKERAGEQAEEREEKEERSQLFGEEDQVNQTSHLGKPQWRQPATKDKYHRKN